MNATVVTALYDINRHSVGDGRTIDQYLNWFEKTLQLKSNLVIFTEPKFEQFILERRSIDNTKIILTNLNEVPYFKYNDRISEIISSPEYREKVNDVSRIECNLSLYNVIQYSKFEWIRQTIENLYFDTDFYFWMDAGCSRFFESFDIQKEWPQNYFILDKDKFNCQGNVNTFNYENNWPGEDKYILDNNCFLVGTLFGGGKEICIKMADLVNQKFEYFLAKGIVNNEQIVLGTLFHEHKSDFSVFTYLNGQHLPFFSLLGQD
jgi:hypothetical protein